MPSDTTVLDSVEVILPHPLNQDEKRILLDFSKSDIGRRKAVLYGLAIGDSLGSTSEFMQPSHVGELFKKYNNRWPLEFVKSHIWMEGEPTDDTDMAMCILKSYYDNQKKFDPLDITNNFIQWLAGRPKDVGMTTRTTLLAAKAKIIKEKELKITTVNKSNGWYAGGIENYKNNPSNFANGSLMRNAVISVCSLDLDIHDAIEQTILHGIATHFASLNVLTCIIQTVLIRKALKAANEGKPLTSPPTIDDISGILNNEWKSFKNSYISSNKCNFVVKFWYKEIKGTLGSMENKLIEELTGFDTFDPYNYNYKGRMGYSVLSLKIALWALYWSFHNDKTPAVPKWLPGWIIEMAKGFESVYLTVLTGADADTYGAIAGPLIAAYHPHNIPKNLVSKLLVLPEIEKYMSKL